MSAAAIIAIHRGRLIRRFRKAGATDPDHAITLGALRQRYSWIFGQMVGAGVFLPTSNGWYYMDEEAATEFLRHKRRRAIIAGGILTALFLVLWACGLIGR